MIDDTELAKQMATHLYDHQERVGDCQVCTEVMRHLYLWFLERPAPWTKDYDVRVDRRGWMVIRHKGCDKRVAEWPHAQGMWPLSYEALLDEARNHERSVHGG